jgi:hypothetical protein
MLFPFLNLSFTMENESPGFSSKNEGHSVQQDAQLIQLSRSMVTLCMIQGYSLRPFKLQGGHPCFLLIILQSTCAYRSRSQPRRSGQ